MSYISKILAMINPMPTERMRGAGMRLWEDAYDRGTREVLPAPVREALAARESFGHLARPMDRRTFFREAVGLPKRVKQFSDMNKLHDDVVAESSLSDRYAEWGDPSFEDLESMASTPSEFRILREAKAASERLHEAESMDGVLALGLEEPPRLTDEALGDLNVLAPSSTAPLMRAILGRFGVNSKVGLE